MNKKSVGKINRALEKALAEELKEITEKDDHGGFKHSPVDRMRVYDRALKLEQIKLKIQDSDWGSQFGSGDEK